MDYSAEIRALVRCLHRPDDMERNAFAVRLKRVTGSATAYTAFATVVEDAFARAGDAYRLHHQVLVRFDFERRVVRERAAADLGVSVRQFFYLHAEAIAIVERHVAGLLQRHESDTVTAPLLETMLDVDPAQSLQVLQATGSAQTAEGKLKQLRAAVLASNLESPHISIPRTLHGPDAAVAHALRALWLELHGRRDDALTCATLAHGMRFDHLGRPHRLAEIALHSARVAIARHDGDAAALKALAAADHWNQHTAIEAALAAGDLSRANELVHSVRLLPAGEPAFRSTALLCLRQSAIQLLSGATATAAQNAYALTHVAKGHADIADMASIVHMRACVAMGSPLAPRERASHGLWYELYDLALRARSACDGNLASNAFVRAACCGYNGIAAHAAATLALLQNDLHRALDAWLLWLRGRHFEQGFDMMPERIGVGLLATEPARRFIHDLAQNEYAHWPVMPFLEAAPARDVFWSALLDASLKGAAPDALAGVMTALLGRTIAVDGAANGNGPSPRPLARLIAILLPFEERDAFIETFAAIVNYCNARARRRRDRIRGRIALQLSG